MTLTATRPRPPRLSQTPIYAALVAERGTPSTAGRTLQR